MDLKKLSKEHLKDATHLLKKKRWAGAYYLAGYAVECALKACIVNRIAATGAIFEDIKFGPKCFTHKLEELFDLAELKHDRELEGARNQTFRANWQIVKDWNEQARYHPKSEHEANDLLTAISDETNGILQWIHKRW